MAHHPAKIRDSDFLRIKSMAEESNMNQKQVAEQLNVTPTGLNRALKRLDPDRTIKWAKHPRRGNYNHIKTETIQQLYDAKHTQKSAAALLGIHARTLRRLCLWRGLDLDWDRTRRPRRKADYTVYAERIWARNDGTWTRDAMAQDLGMSREKLRRVMQVLDPQRTFQWAPRPVQSADDVRKAHRERERARRRRARGKGKDEHTTKKLPDYGVRKVGGFAVIS